jgi:uncharacterized DUF497 family protein
VPNNASSGPLGERQGQAGVYPQRSCSSELRKRLVGLTTTWVLLLVVNVMRGDVIRIISARMVTKAEREIYENQ